MPLGERQIQSRGLLIHRGLPVKTHVFAYDFEPLYGTTEQALGEVSWALEQNPHLLHVPQGSKYLYGIAFPYGYNQHNGLVRMVDFYGFAFDRSWSRCNPEWDAYVFKNGILQPDTPADCEKGMINSDRRVPRGCETGLIILGREAELRRHHATDHKLIREEIDLFLNAWPVFADPDLEPIDLRTPRVEVK